MQTINTRKAFTLIELLIVVAIIAILAAIAIPNLLEASIRSKVARVLSDQRMIALAIEAYQLDEQEYMPYAAWGYHGNPDYFNALTTPIPHLVAIPTDLFYDEEIGDRFPGRTNYGYYSDMPIGSSGNNSYWKNTIKPALEEYPDVNASTVIYIITSAGPTRFLQLDNGQARRVGNTKAALMFYDASNGTRSWGDILRLGPK